FLIGDVETPASSLVVAASSSDQSLVPDGNILLGGSNTARTVTITPALHQIGSVNITLVVTDGDGMAASQTFQLHINAANHAPTADSQSVSVLKDSPQAILLTGSDPDGNALSYSILST